MMIYTNGLKPFDDPSAIDKHKNLMSVGLRFVIMLSLVLGQTSVVEAGLARDAYLSVAALAITKDGKTVFITGAALHQTLSFGAAPRKVLAAFPMPETPLGLALSADEQQLFVTCAKSESKLCVLEVSTGKITATIPLGHTSLSPVISPDGKTLHVCNQFDNDVSVIDLVAQKEVRRIPVQREPVAADLTKDGKYLLVANQLPAGRADAAYVGAVISVIDVAAGKVIKELQLPHGSTSLKDIRISPDGKHAAVTHILARFEHPTTHVFRGWINVSGLTIIDIPSLSIKGSILLDEPNQGAANPWGLAWTPDNSKLLVTHAGTHEVSVIDFHKIYDELIPVSQVYSGSSAYAKHTKENAVDSNYLLPFLVSGRERVKLPEGDLGPRAVVVCSNIAYVANYFSDTISVIDLAAKPLRATSVSLGPKKEMDLVRKGEFYFNDASICFQGWQSCSSCHPDGRVDGLNWDRLHDGTGNPKNTLSLLLAHQTPPSMSLRIRESAEVSVRAAIKSLLFTNLNEEVPLAIDAYLKSLKPVPSPHLVKGKLSPAAERGKAIFNRAGCADCHPPGLFTDLKAHDVGTRRDFDKPTDRFDTPTLIEAWRTAPYLHDGSAATIKEVLTTHNREDKMGNTSTLSREEIDDLCTYILSL